MPLMRDYRLHNPMLRDSQQRSLSGSYIYHSVAMFSVTALSLIHAFNVLADDQLGLSSEEISWTLSYQATNLQAPPDTTTTATIPATALVSHPGGPPA